MSNLVEYILKIRDLWSGQMQRLANNTDSAFNRMGNRINQAGTSVNDLNRRIDQPTRTRNISLDTSAITRANREITALENRRDRLTNTGSGGSGIIGKGLMLGAIGGLAALGGNAIKAGMERQMASTSFEIMAGKKQGGELHKNLIGFATDTVYGNEVFGEAKTLLGFGVAAKNVMPIMKMLGDISLADSERMQALSLAFAQTTAAGKLMGQDMIQYSTAGFNPLQALSQMTGKSMAYFKDKMQQGKISAIDVAKAMEYATGPMGMFYKGMEKMSQTDTGKIKAFTGALGTFAGTIGMGLLPVVGSMVDGLNWLSNHSGLMYGLAAGIGTLATAWGLYALSASWQVLFRPPPGLQCFGRLPLYRC